MALRLSDLDAKTAARIQAQIDAQAPAKKLVTTYHFVTQLMHIQNDDPVALAKVMDAWRSQYPLLPYTIYKTEEMK